MVRRAVRADLASLVRRKRRLLRREMPELLPLFERTVDFVLRPGSKRLRAFLVYAGYWFAGGREAARVRRLAVAVELCHAALLIHDDIADRDLRRRGGPTVHAALRAVSPRRANAEQYSQAQAMLLGSLLAIWARQLVLSSNDSARTTRALALRIEDLMEVTHRGEILDVLLGERSVATREQILRVYKAKTARYTVEAPLQLGALAAGASPRMLRFLSRYGRPLGIAFQLQDDILGTFGSSRAIGKSTTTDLEQGKKTLLFDAGLRLSRGRNRVRLRALLARRRGSRKGLRTVRRILQACGALAVARTEAERLARQAHVALTRGSSSDMKRSAFLMLVARLLAQRTR